MSPAKKTPNVLDSSHLHFAAVYPKAQQVQCIFVHHLSPALMTVTVLLKSTPLYSQELKRK